MKKPTLAQLKEANPEFFSVEWTGFFSDATYEVVPNPERRGEFFLVMDHKYTRPRYVIEENLDLTYDGEEL